MSQETIERTFVVPQPARLRVSNICGSVDVQPSTDAEVKVTAVKHLDWGNAERTRIEIEQKSDGRVAVKTHYDHEHGLEWLTGSRPCKVDYTVQVPVACTVQVQAVSSTIRIQGLQGDMEVKSVSGDVSLVDLTGKVEVNVVSADVEAHHINGPMTAVAVSGKVDMRESNCPTIAASTVSGDMKLETPLGNGPYDFHSVSGSIGLMVPGETGCRVHMTSISGRLHTDLPVTSTDAHHGHRNIEVQGGGVLLEANTVSGSFSLEHIGEIQSKPAQKTPEERKAILEHVAEGGISVEEALSQLKGN